MRLRVELILEKCGKIGYKSNMQKLEFLKESSLESMLDIFSPLMKDEGMTESDLLDSIAEACFELEESIFASRMR